MESEGKLDVKGLLRSIPYSSFSMLERMKYSQEVMSTTTILKLIYTLFENPYFRNLFEAKMILIHLHNSSNPEKT